MVRTLTWLATLCLTLTLAAQDPIKAGKREARLTAMVIAGLHEIADAMDLQRQHGTALALRREILLEYDENDAKARTEVGFTKVGQLWQPDPNKLVIDRDLSGDKRELRKIQKKFDKLRKEQLREHQAVAAMWEKAGDALRATTHFRRVLALDPADKEAAAALSLARFQGFRGNDAELHMLRRAWAIRGAVDWLHRAEIVVTSLEQQSHPLLAKAEIAHAGVRTENFTVWGTLPQGQLQATAQHCERALQMFRTVFGTCEGQTFEPRPRRGLVLVDDEAAYHKVLDQCADSIDAARLHFLKHDVDMAFLDAGGEQVRFIKTNGSDDEAFDQSVRGVAQDVIGCSSEGLWEGVGHAGCGLLFGKTITFLLEQQSARTVAAWARQMLVPDIKVWMQIAAKSAWSKSDTRSSELVLLNAARFTTEQRVKAWAICDYFFHWRPELVWQLDQSRNEEIRSPPDVEAEFERRTGIPLPKIDADWREFWSRQVALREAMFADPLGDPKGKDRKLRSEARELVDAVNAMRSAAERGPVGFYFAEDVDVQAALNYGVALTKAERDQQRRPKEVIPMPTLPEGTGPRVLYSRADSPAAAVETWWANPAWRDRLLHPGRGLLGANRNDIGGVVDLTEPVMPTTRGLPQTWPRRGQRDVPGSARVADLGPRAIAALQREGKQPDDIVAMPFTIHFARAMSADDLAVVEAFVYYGAARAVGVLVRYQGEGAGGPGDAADGCVAWIGLEPPPPGSEVEVGWNVPEDLLAKDERFRTATFTIRE